MSFPSECKFKSNVCWEQLQKKVSQTSLFFLSQFIDTQCLCSRVNKPNLHSIKFEVLPKVLIFLYSKKSLPIESCLHSYVFVCEPYFEDAFESALVFSI